MSVWKVGLQAVVIASVVSVAGFWGMWREFSDRTAPHTYIGTFSVGGLREIDIPGALDAYEQEFLAERIMIRLRTKDRTYTMAELGMQLDKKAMLQEVRERHGKIAPVVLVKDTAVQENLLEHDFSDIVRLPKDPTFTIRPDYTIAIVPGVAGEKIDVVSLNRDIALAVRSLPYSRVLASTIRAVPHEDPNMQEELRAYAEHLLKSGFTLLYGEQTFVIPRQDIALMIHFQDVLGGRIEFDEQRIQQYLIQHIAPSIHRDTINARFEIQDGRVTQFALPQHGQELDIPESIQAIQAALASRASSVALAVDKKQPSISDTESTVALGVTSLLSRGETDFKGSPKNRIHNIQVGASRYHGLLIPPGQEFSFNEFLGPVNALSGFKPELVIKNNVTTPEFGGGLCQVSTTMFRAAVYAGAKITTRRNHSYAVRYYGTPGFDATIYPPYTDFRFLNNTPGYLLIQTKIDGTRLTFELWGTHDGREVIVDGPHPYHKLPSGAVKATLTQKVVRDGETLIEDTFRSNYKSPALFPRL